MTQVDELKVAQLFLERHRPADAEQHARRHLSQSPDDAWGHQTLALALNAQKRYREALAEAKLAVSLSPEEAHIYYTLANVYYHTDLLQECETAVDRAIELCPTHAPYWGLKANVKMAQDNWRGALAAADEGLRHAPTHIHCQNLRALALARLQKKDVAETGFEESLRQDPENALTFAYQGWMYVHHADADKALTAFAEALRLDPTNDWARTGMFYALREKHLLFHLARKVQRPVPMVFGWMGFIFGLPISITLMVMAAHNFWLIPLAVLSWTITISLLVLLYLPIDMRDDTLKAIMLFDKRGKYLLSPAERSQAVRVYFGAFIGLFIGIGLGFAKDSKQWKIFEFPKLTNSEQTALVCIGLELVLILIAVLAFFGNEMPEQRRNSLTGVLLTQIVFLPVAICSALGFFTPSLQTMLMTVSSVWILFSGLLIWICSARLRSWISKQLELLIPN